MEQFKDAHYFHIPSQGNIYTMTELRLANGKSLVLAASLKRDIFYFEYSEASLSLDPATKEISFTYIPSGAEIISIDAFNKSSITNEAVIGITIIKNSNDSDTLETFLNIYSQLEEHEDFNIENIAQNCLTVELNFIPYQLMHTELITWKGDKIAKKEIVFILTGSDNLVHIYHENTSEHSYKDIDNRDLFPEFGKTPSPVIWIDICHLNNYEEDVLKYGLSDYLTLARHNNSTVFTSCIVADIDFDGQKEILLGTGSEEIILYKRDIKENKWYLEEIKNLVAPILSMTYLDISGDGVKELIVSSMKGIHVLQHDPKFVQKKLTERVDAL
ncbi:hypothetical protein YQE_08822, partial [Dendroctonus ponderosae]